MARQEQLSRQDLQFVHWYRKYRDVYKAAERAHVAKNKAKKTYERIEIQEEIERQDSVVERERARVQVEAEGISKTMLDTELMQLIMLDARKHPEAKRKAVELGYVRAGVLKVGNTISLDMSQSNADEDAPLPTVYTAVISGAVQVTPIMPEGKREEVAFVPPPKTPPPTSGSPAPAIAPAPATLMPPPVTKGPLRAGRIKIG